MCVKSICVEGGDSRDQLWYVSSALGDLVFVVLVNTTQPAQAIVAVMAVQIYVSSAPVVRSRPASAPVGTSRC